ncbi:hypothetical protein [Zhongshania sp.]|jgi:hypothetical protein|uniref:hypothetical protein n=1 Tax=Zhongshania sp. TaxID=1971902 RepID=UPI002A81FDDB|nr:hypothetical protein [Zhongshania sp.]
MNWTEHPLVRRLDTTIAGEISLTSASSGASINHHALVPGLLVLLGELGSEREPSVLLRNLPGHLNKCLRSLEQLHKLQLEVMQLHTQQVDKTNSLQFLEAATRERFAVAVESFLGYLVQVQNHWVGLLALSLPGKKGSLPASLNDIVKGITNNKASVSGLPEVIKTNLMQYWTEHGKLARLYRDYSEHFGEVVSDVIIFKQQDGEFGLICQLLNNPEAKSAAKAKWGKPPIHCLLYVLSEFEVLVSFTGWLIKQLLPSNDGTVKMNIELFKSTFPEFVGPGIVHYGLAPANTIWIQEVIDLAVKTYSPFNHDK